MSSLNGKVIAKAVLAHLECRSMIRPFPLECHDVVVKLYSVLFTLTSKQMYICGCNIVLCHGPLVALLISLECSKLGMTGKTEDSSGILAQKWSQLVQKQSKSITAPDPALL